MYSSQPPVSDIIELADRWSLDETSGVFKAMAINNQGIDVAYWVTSEMLNTCHPKLGNALHALCSWESRINADEVRGMYVRYTLLNFENGVFSMVDPKGERQLFHMINNLKFDNDHPDEVRVIGIKLVKWIAPENFNNVEVISSNMVENRLYPKTLLDEQFPGWENRLAAHTSLELGYNELKNFVLTSTRSPAEEASHLTELNLPQTP